MVNGDKSSGKPTPVTPTGRQMVSELAHRSGAGVHRMRRTPEVVCQQGDDWARGNACFPQKLVQLVGYRDPESRPSSPLRRRPQTVSMQSMSLSDTPSDTLSDTPIG